jgi:hypothetical protein
LYDGVAEALGGEFVYDDRQLQGGWVRRTGTCTTDGEQENKQRASGDEDRFGSQDARLA